MCEVKHQNEYFAARENNAVYVYPDACHFLNKKALK